MIFSALSLKVVGLIFFVHTLLWPSRLEVPEQTLDRIPLGLR